MTTDAGKAAKEWVKSYAYMMPNTNPCKERVLAAQEEGFLAGAAWAAPKWISVKERLPEPLESVLICYGPTNSAKNDYRMECWNWPILDGVHDVYEVEFVTHWMPLPDAPKEEK